MPTQRIRAALSPLVVLVLAGCATMRIRTDYSSETSFARLKTYSWATQERDAGDYLTDGDDYRAEAGESPAFDSPLLEQRIRYVVDSTLASRGYRKVDSDTPDFRVAYRVVADERTTVRRSYGYPGYYYGRSYGHYGFGHGHFGHGHFGHGGHFGYSGYYAPAYVRQYLRGNLVLDIVDGRTNELLWRGWASESLDYNPKPEKVRKYVDEAVQKVLEEFPPTD